MKILKEKIKWLLIKLYWKSFFIYCRFIPTKKNKEELPLNEPLLF